ncbi:hypothetical protein EOD39_7236 [Acipenser ruthenus]|uniref:WD repeat-containing protein 53 n=1 Tax=Acipenser ruthenus TaxID=7906 RepID=A0A662Z0C0_ACIRT|nr:hypothetical protein EOD39_7236 [Acipenser ruthenus]
MKLSNKKYHNILAQFSSVARLLPQMLCSTLYSAVALTGSTLCFMICCTGLVKGPLCAYKVTFSNRSQGLEWGYPLEQFSTREVNYLYNRTSWFTVCVEPHNVVLWNVVLFCILLVLSGAETLLCVVQILNGIAGCVFGPGVRNNKKDVVLMQVMLWNLQKARPLWVLNLQKLGEEEQQQCAGQLFNPPLAHAITVATCGNSFACGSEDGSIHVFKVAGTRFERQAGFKGHSQGVSQVHFVNFLSHPHWLVSGGNDGKVLLWDASAGSATVSKEQAKGGHRRKAKSVKSQSASKEGADHNTELEVIAFSPKLSINHEEKVNWICPAQLKGEGWIIVADQSSSLSVYPITGL